MADPIVLSIGSVNLDLQVSVERRPEISETLLGSRFLAAGGGKGANVALLTRRLGAGAALVARLGGDEFAERALAPLREGGVDLARVLRLEGRDTGVSMVTVPPDGRKGIVLAANANRDWEPGAEACAREAVAEAPRGSVLVVDCEVPEAVVLAAIRAACGRGIRVVLDPSPADRATDAMLAGACHAVPNAGEARALTGVEVRDPASALEAARRLRERGVRAPVVKLAGGGCVALEGGRASHVPAAEVEVVDTNGAGDAFAGGLAVALLEGRALAEACAFASAAAGLTVTGWGAQAAQPDRGAVERLAAELGARATGLGG